MSGIRAFMLCLAVGWLIPDPVSAASVSPQTFQTLQQTEKLLDRKEYSQALQGLEARLQSVSRTQEKAILLRAIASVHTLRGDYRQAAAFLSKALATKSLPAEQQRKAQLTLGQLYLAQEKAGQAALILERWLRSTPRVRPEDHVLLAQVHARLKHYQKALQHLDQALAKVATPRDEWLQLRLGLNFQLRRYRAAATDLKTLIHRHPQEKNYWQQLAGLYQLRGQALSGTAVLELEYLLGLLKQESEILHLVASLRAVHTPYVAAELLQQALAAGRVRHTAKHLELLAAAWTEAREPERAIQTLTEAARMHSTGHTWLRLAQLHMGRGNWKAAIAALRKALAENGLENPGRTWLLLGNAYFELGEPGRARTAFRRAANYPSTRKIAREWLNYLERQQTDQAAGSTASSAVKAG